MRWKCRNCGNEFESKEEDFEDEADAHLDDCLDKGDYIERLE